MNISIGRLKDASSMRCIGGVIAAKSRNSFPIIALEGGFAEDSNPGNGSVGCELEAITSVPVMCMSVVSMPVEDGTDPSSPVVSGALLFGVVNWDHPRRVELERNCSHAS
jgi:hypothetical protein